MYSEIMNTNIGLVKLLRQLHICMTGGVHVAQFQFLHDIFTLLSTKRNELVHDLKPTQVHAEVIITVGHQAFTNQLARLPCLV